MTLTRRSAVAAPRASRFDWAFRLVTNQRVLNAATLLCIAFAMLLLAPIAQAQYTVLNEFNGTDGATSYAGLVADSQGNLYGTTASGGFSECDPPYGCGTVFKLSPPSSGSGPWTETVLFTFYGGTTGAVPFAGVTLDAQGNLYGATIAGGTAGSCTLGTSVPGCGLVFKLTPTSSGPWTESILHYFLGGTSGWGPVSSLTFDSHGNLYGTTYLGGVGGYSGMVYELTPTASGPWTENIVHNFTGGSDGDQPWSNLIFDAAGNLYGTTYEGGSHGYGVVYELTSPGAGLYPWNENVIYNFTGGSDGAYPYAGVVFDSHGNLYGTTFEGGTGTGCNYPLYSCGVVYEVSSPGAGIYPWTETVLHVFCPGGGNVCRADGTSPYAGVIFDSHGNLYGDTWEGGKNLSGIIYKLNPPVSGSGPWTETQIYTFGSLTSGGSDPRGGLLFDALGNLYGTTQYGGEISTNFSDGGGTVFELPNPRATNTALTAAPNPSTGGQTVVFAATVSPTPTAATGYGSVSFTANGAVIGVVPPSNGVATLDYSALLASGSPYNVIAHYSGATELAGSTSNTVSQVVSLEPTTTVLTAPGGSTWGQSVTLTATVSSGNSVTPVGTVSFKVGGVLLGNKTLTASGTGQAKASLSTTALPVGADSLTAHYSGSTLMQVSTSATSTVTVSKASSTTTVATSGSPSLYGQTITFTATVTAEYGGIPTGTVTFYAGNGQIGVIPLANNGEAKLNISSLSPATYAITAKYNGSTDVAASSLSPAITQAVNQIATTTTVVSSAPSSAYGQSLTFSATVTPASGTTVPTGSVEFLAGTTEIGVEILNGAGVAMLPTTAVPVGNPVTVTAKYLGTGLFTANSGTTMVTVSQATSTTAVTSSANPSVYGQTISFTATVSPQFGGTATGTVTFYKNSVSVGVLPLSGNKATLPITTLTPATYSITATYNGSNNVAGSNTTTALSQVVNKAAATTVVVSSSPTVMHGNPVTFTATVTATPPSTTVPPGSVIFYDTFGTKTTELGVGTLSGGKATVTHTYTAAQEGSHSVTATYTGSAYVSASPASPAITQTVD